MLNIAKKIFGTENDRKLKKLKPIVDKINAMEPDFVSLTDEQLKAKTAEFRGRFDGGESLDDMLPEAFATVREAAKRTLGQRHYDVQLIGGITLHRGEIAEMRTGEGKTLVSTLAAYLNGLTGRGVHIVTVNDYLAKRDSEWMGQIYNFLGLNLNIVSLPSSTSTVLMDHHLVMVVSNASALGFCIHRFAVLNGGGGVRRS